MQLRSRQHLPLASYVNPSLMSAYSVKEESRIHDALYKSRIHQSLQPHSLDMSSICAPIVPIFHFNTMYMKSAKLPRGNAPVTGASNILGQAESRAGNDSSRRLIDQELECERAAVDCFLPRACVRRPADPCVPVIVRLLQVLSFSPRAKRHEIWTRDTSSNSLRTVCAKPRQQGCTCPQSTETYLGQDRVLGRTQGGCTSNKL